MNSTSHKTGDAQISEEDFIGCSICYETEVEIIKSPCNHGACKDCWGKLVKISCHMCNNKNIRDWYIKNIKQVPDEIIEEEFDPMDLILSENHIVYFAIDCYIEEYFEIQFMNNGNLIDYNGNTVAPDIITKMRIETVSHLINNYIEDGNLVSAEMLNDIFPEIVKSIDLKNINEIPTIYMQSEYFLVEYIRVMNLLKIGIGIFNNITESIIFIGNTYGDSFAIIIIEEYVNRLKKSIFQITEDTNLGQVLDIEYLYKKCSKNLLSYIKNLENNLIIN